MRYNITNILCCSLYWIQSAESVCTIKHAVSELVHTEWTCVRLVFGYHCDKILLRCRNLIMQASKAIETLFGMPNDYWIATFFFHTHVLADGMLNFKSHFWHGIFAHVRKSKSHNVSLRYSHSTRNRMLLLITIIRMFLASRKDREKKRLTKWMFSRSHSKSLEFIWNCRWYRYKFTHVTPCNSNAIIMILNWFLVSNILSRIVDNEQAEKLEFSILSRKC